MRSLLVALLVALSLTAALHAEAPSIRGRVLDPSGLPLPGAVVTLSQPDTEPITVVAGTTGDFEFDSLVPGRYAVRAELDGFDATTLTDLDATDGMLSVVLRLALAGVRQEVTVTAAPAQDVIDATRPDAPVTVTRTVMDIAMLPNSQFDDVLALMPNVIRGPDGGISIGGARPTTGGLVVNGIDQRDPIFGGAGLMLPLEAVDTLQVYAAGAPAEFGGASGGITSAQTRAGADKVRLRLESFVPRLLFGQNALHGVEFWDPDLGASGPIVPGRVTFQQAVSYRFDRNSFTTLSGPDHNLFKALLSWTQLDTRVTDAQHLRVSLAFDPRTTDHTNVTAFTPSASTPSLHQGGSTGAVSYSVASGRLAAELRLGVRSSQADIGPDGEGPYIASHLLVSGRYFDQQQRRATQTDSSVQLTWSAATAHAITAGASVEHGSLLQDIEADPVTMLYSDGSPARIVTFTPQAGSTAQGTTTGTFVQDRWTVAPWLTLDLGVRHDVSSVARMPVLQPRLGWMFGSAQSAIAITGSAGLFADAVPLSALSFSGLPVRIVTTAAPNLFTTTVSNLVAPSLSAPTALHWNVTLDRRFDRVLVRVRYDERRVSHELVIHAGSIDAAAGTPSVFSVLSSDGESHARTVEATLGFHARSGTEAYASYVRGATFGPQNDPAAVEGLLRAPFAQTDAEGPLPNDVPNRVLAWGVFQLPSRITVAPFLDTRSGFPFTAIDDAWTVVGAPGTFRLPWMTTLDLSATRITRLPHHLPDARVGVKLYNLIDVHTERSVQRDLERTDFGSRYDPVPRDFTFVFELLWGNSRR